MNTFDFDLELFLNSFTEMGASITKGTGKLFVDGKETDVISALKNGFCDLDDRVSYVYKTPRFDVTAQYKQEAMKNSNWALSQKQTMAA